MRFDVQFPPTTASVTGLLTTVLLLFVVRAAYKAIVNFYNARSIGLPIIFSPTDQTGIVWSLLSVRYRSRLAQVLPAWLWRRVALTVPGWEVYHKSKPFDKDASVRDGKSQSFVLVGPSTYEVWTVDPVAVHDVQQRVHDFEQAKALAVLLGKYGPNVITSNGERWARYRRPVATVLNERISGANFEAAVRHAEEVFGPVLPSSLTGVDASRSKINVPQLFDMITKLTFNVLISASIGDDKFPWSSEEAQGRRESGYKFTYTESLHLFLDNFYGVSMLPLSVINNWPKWLTGYETVSSVGQAITEYRQRMRSMLDLERDRLASEKQMQSGKADLLALLVKASEDEAHTGMALTNDELVANLFVFIAGGFKTIAAALQTALVALAAYPQWQDWLLEEVDAIVSSSSENADSWEYAKVFPQAVRHVAFILEMMRLHGSSTRLTRIASGPQTMQTSGATVHIPPKTRVHVDSMALHVLPCWAGINRQSDPAFVNPKTDTGDEYSFPPSRWINPPGSDKTHYLPPKGDLRTLGHGPAGLPRPEDGPGGDHHRDAADPQGPPRRGLPVLGGRKQEPGRGEVPSGAA
ncbi:hypothetical protein PG993_013141 [Apiospora rasikravindrae]|uniref:Cytochrome P450 n=1 Tax=Apiospora rasikravindrae TaxID=990691 RepID=A0ABR1RWU5_9PEZI